MIEEYYTKKETLDLYRKVVRAIFGTSISIILIWMFVGPRWRVWQQGMAGEARLRRAEQEKQILIEQARAEVESAKLRAEAISTIGEAAKKFPEYRHQEFVGAFAEALQAGVIDQIIYVPTEANVPLVRTTN